MENLKRVRKLELFFETDAPVRDHVRRQEIVFMSAHYDGQTYLWVNPDYQIDHDHIKAKFKRFGVDSEPVWLRIAMKSEDSTDFHNMMVEHYDGMTSMVEKEQIKKFVTEATAIVILNLPLFIDPILEFLEGRNYSTAKVSIGKTVNDGISVFHLKPKPRMSISQHNEAIQQISSIEIRFEKLCRLVPLEVLHNMPEFTALLERFNP